MVTQNRENVEYILKAAVHLSGPGPIIIIITIIIVLCRWYTHHRTFSGELILIIPIEAATNWPSTPTHSKVDG